MHEHATLMASPESTRTNNPFLMYYSKTKSSPLYSCICMTSPGSPTHTLSYVYIAPPGTIPNSPISTFLFAFLTCVSLTPYLISLGISFWLPFILSLP